jgi:hypothetical protein
LRNEIINRPNRVCSLFLLILRFLACSLIRCRTTPLLPPAITDRILLIGERWPTTTRRWGSGVTPKGQGQAPGPSQPPCHTRNVAASSPTLPPSVDTYHVLSIDQRQAEYDLDLRFSSSSYTRTSSSSSSYGYDYDGGSWCLGDCAVRIPHQSRVCCISLIPRCKTTVNYRDARNLLPLFFYCRCLFLLLYLIIRLIQNICSNM